MRSLFPAWFGNMLVPVGLLWVTPGYGLNHMHVQNGTEKVYFLEPVLGGAAAAEVEITQEEPGQYKSSGLPLDPRGTSFNRGGEPVHGALLQPRGRCRVAFKPRPGERFETTLRLLEMKDFQEGDDTVVETVVAHLTLVVDHRGRTPVTTLRGRPSPGMASGPVSSISLYSKPWCSCPTRSATATTSPRPGPVNPPGRGPGRPGTPGGPGPGSCPSWSLRASTA